MLLCFTLLKVDSACQCLIAVPFKDVPSATCLAVPSIGAATLSAIGSALACIKQQQTLRFEHDDQMQPGEQPQAASRFCAGRTSTSCATSWIVLLTSCVACLVASLVAAATRSMSSVALSASSGT